MSPLLLRALRRLAGYALVFAIGLVVVFKVLPAFGLLGPSAADEIDTTGRALETAQVYGAEAGLPSLDAAQAGLKHAREMLAAGHNRSAKQAALDAREHAIGAQREALARREDERRQARQIVADIDHLLSGLEELYSQAAEGKDKLTTGRLLGVMRDARETGASLFLAFEQGNFRKVITEGEAVKAHLAETMATLVAAGNK
jgi:hypothetical protein